MSRAIYGRWLADVDDATASAALGAAGLAAVYAPALLHRPYPPADISGLLLRGWNEHGSPTPARWTDPVLAPGWDPARAAPARTFAEAWGQWVLGGGALSYPARLVLDPAPDATRLRWVVTQLAHGGTASFIPLPEGPDVPRPWRFPIRIGVLTGQANRALHEQLLQAQNASTTEWRRRLLEVVVVGRERVTCDVLVVAGGRDAAGAAAVRKVREVCSQVVLVVDDAGSDDGLAGALAIATTTGAWAVGLGATAEPSNWVIEFCRELTHNVGVDVAFLHARRRSSEGLLFARPDIVAEQLLARGARAAATAITDALSVDVEMTDEAGLESVDPHVGPLDAARRAAPDVLSRLSLIADNGRHAFEDTDATDIEEAMRRTAPLTQYATARRFLRAQISPADEPTRTLDAFRVDTKHRIRVDVGPFSSSQLVPAVPLDTVLPETPQRLTVVLTEPTLLDAPLAAWLDLPALGTSEPVEFTLTTGPDTVVVDARLIVLSGNRVVHTARLPQAVAPAPVTVRRTPTTVETAISPLSIDLAERRTFDAALVVDAADHAASTVTAMAGFAAASVRIDDLSVKEAVDRIANRLGEIVAAPDEYGALDAPAVVELLRFLAVHGGMLRDALIADTEWLGDVLAPSRYVQVVSARKDAYFPFELAYDFPAPDLDAVLCPNAAAALAADDLDATCPGPRNGTTVCPFGFWGLNRVIERHAVPPDDVDVGLADFLLTSTPRTYRHTISLGSNVVGASGRVDSAVRGSIDTVVGALHAQAATRQVVDWTEWRQALDVEPSLLMLLPHTVYDDLSDLYGLEIGTAARLFLNKINKRFMPKNPAIIVLLGCETARAGEVGYERFPSVLRRAGAEVVVATLTEILGRHAAPVAEAFAQELYAACGDQPAGVGDVMVQLRRRMLARGIPAVLALAVFGDADWSITTEGR